MADITHQLLDALLEEHRLGAQLYGSEEHEAFVVSAVEWMPALIEAAREHIPGETLAEIHIPGFLPKGNLNSREHYMARSRRVKKEHEIVGLALAAGARSVRHRWRSVGRVVITRCSVGKPDSDQVVANCKGVRDAVAKFLGIDDGDPSITWVVEQKKTPRAGQGTSIRIEGRRG